MNSIKTLIIVVVISVVMIASSFADGQQEKETGGGEVISLTMAHHLPPTTVQHKAMEFFAEKANEYSNGQIEITVSHSGQLGGQRELVESAKLGTIELVLGEAGRYEAYAPVFGVFSLPFIFKDIDDYHQTVDGEIGRKFETILEEKAGLTILAWVDGGIRNVFITKEPTASVSSMKGVKIRTPESPVYVNTFKALGANPTPIAATEMYSALHSGVVDAMEGSFETAYTFKIYEVAKYCLETGHINTDISFAINTKIYKNFSNDLQSAIKKAAVEAANWQRAEFASANEKFKEMLGTEGGLTFVTANHAEFVNAVSPVYDTFSNISEECAAILREMSN